MPSRYYVQVNYLSEGESRVLGHDQEGYHTTSGTSRTALSFDSENEARRAIALARESLLPLSDRVYSMQVNRIALPDPPYTGPRPTIWDRITGDDDNEQP